MKKSKLNTTINSKRWKIAIFSIVLLIAAGAIVYSVITLNSGEIAATSNDLKAQDGANTSSNTPSAPDISDLTWVKNLKVTFAEHDFAFIILPGNDVDSNRNVEKEIANASAKIQSDGIIVDTLSLDKQNPEYSITIDRMAITRLPAVFAVNSSGYGMIIVGDITETKLLQAFLTAAKACAPGASSGCCP